MDAWVAIDALGSLRYSRRRSLVCPVQALLAYAQQTQSQRQTDQLFVCFRLDLLGRLLFKAHVSHCERDPTGICGIRGAIGVVSALKRIS